MNSKGRRGRPLGFRLSEESKKRISKSKEGQRHKEKTKEKISKSLYIYFRQRNSLSEEIINKYCKYSEDEDICAWVLRLSDKINKTSNVVTNKVLRNKNMREITYGHNIDRFGHTFTPEFILLFKEYCQLNNIDVGEIFIEE